MHIAVGYRWFPTSIAYHLERSLKRAGCAVTYVGLPCDSRPGYDSATPIDRVVAELGSTPDVFLWVDAGGRYFPLGIEELPIPSACYLIDVHLGHWRPHAARFFDMVFVAQKDYLPRYRDAVGHDQVYWLPLAAAEDRHRRLELPRIYEVAFVGNIARAHRTSARLRRLKKLASRFNTNDFFRHYPPDEVGRVYSQAKVVFNTSIAGDVTMRIFEGSGCGALMLTDSDQNGLRDLFEIGNEIVLFRDDEDLIEKISYYLAHDKERVEIAEAGYRRTTEDHTYGHRAQRILELTQGADLGHRASLRTASDREVSLERRTVLTHLHMLDALCDEGRRLGLGPVRRLYWVLPCLVRRLMM